MSGGDANPRMGLMAWLKGRLFGTGNIKITPKNCSLGISITGQIPPVNGGLGISTTPTNGMVPIGNGSDYTAATLTQGTGITITNGAGSITIAATGGGGSGTVTSVGLSAPSVFAVGGTPITTSGTLALTFATGQTANEFLATPNGTTGAVGLRAMVAADQPSTTVNSTGNLSPLFTASISAQALSYTLSTATNPSWFGCDGSTTPAYQTGGLPPTVGGLGTMLAPTLTGQIPISQSATAYSPTTIAGDATLAASGALTLAAVNTSPGSFTNANLTVNAKGLITACSNGSGGGISGSGTADQVMYWSGSSTAAGDTGFTFNPSTNALTLGLSASAGSLIISGSASGAVTIQAAASAGSAIFTLGTVAITEVAVQAATTGAIVTASTAGSRLYSQSTLALGGSGGNSEILTLGSSSFNGNIILEKGTGGNPATIVISGQTSGTVSLQAPAVAGSGGGLVLPSVPTQGPTVQAAATGALVFGTTSGAQNYTSGQNSLRSSLIQASGNQLPTSGAVSGQYWHFGNWTQTGAMTWAPGTRVFCSGNFTPLATSVISVSALNNGGVGATGNTSITGQAGGGMGGASTADTAASSVAGGGGGGFGGGGGIGGSATANLVSYGGYEYQWQSQFSGSGGSGGNTTAAADSGGGGGGGGGGIYIECAGNFAFSGTPTAPVIVANGIGGGNGVTLGGGGGGGSGGVVVIRAGGTCNLSSFATAITCLGGNGGNGATATGGKGGGGGGGLIDVCSAGTLTSSLSSAAVNGGAAGTTGSATQPAQAGGGGFLTTLSATTPVSCF